MCFNFLPPQRHHIGDRSLSLCNMFLDEMAKQARNLITDICTEQCTLSDQVRTHRGSQFKGIVCDEFLASLLSVCKDTAAG